MDKVGLLNAIPPIMSVIASAGAAIAAFGSLKVSKEAKELSKQSALAIHHNEAAITISNITNGLPVNMRNFIEIADELYFEWPKEFESIDDRSLGGDNPRPIRHVFTNASEMLVNHSTIRTRYSISSIKRSMSTIFHGNLYNLTEDEYIYLLKKADGKYCDFEGIFGTPEHNCDLGHSKAFRWACYQLSKRISDEQYLSCWKYSWSQNGFISRYEHEHSKVVPLLTSMLNKLQREQEKLAHSVFPLETNPSLISKYEVIQSKIEALIKDCNVSHLSFHKESLSKQEIITRIVFAMAVGCLASKILDDLLYNTYD
ncbi:hypothetical protein PSECIP111951_00978 [Pseudoalteromonas holothuriae]|uniref:Uncharacterized protein n=1 Tax=Pseudoalteromonas holothuriae TaxID=2963714 RepID=A0ABM9GH27_9GAMM|nr:hypothetical protein [Pseudoalteromonas sp. CIP111951]CAH9054171.1 hypothetical protein PSECIP111951_00978 [Pseudoalteromonas sp. CIP111951]